MRGITGNENAAVTEMLRGIGCRPPMHHVLDRDGDVRYANCGADHLQGAVGCQTRRNVHVRPGGVANRVDGKEGAFERLLETEKPSQLGMIRIDHRPELAFEKPAQVRAEIDRDALGKRAMPEHLDSEALADGAMRAVRSNQVLGMNPLYFTRIPMTDNRRDAVRVLLERDTLGRKQHPRAKLFRALLERRLERVLRQEDTHRRADVANTVVEICDVVRRSATRQGLDTDNARVLNELRFRLGAYDLLQSDAAEDFHRALGDRSGAWVNRRASVMLNDKGRHPVMPQQQRRRHADHAAADDQDWNLDIGIVAHR